MLCGLAAELALGREKLLDVRVCPHALRDSGINGRQRLPRQAAVTVDLLEQPFRARDAVLRDGVVAARIPCETRKLCAFYLSFSPFSLLSPQYLYFSSLLHATCSQHLTSHV